jgi:L-xylulokinase
MKRHIIAFDAGGTAVKAAIYDERGMERAAAAAGMAPLHPAPGCLEREPEAMWAAICEVARKVLSSADVAPSSIAAVGLTGYGNGLFLLDRDGRPVRNAILSPDQRARAILARWRIEGAEARSVEVTYNAQFPGKPLPLIAWLDANEPEALQHADRALFCKDYLRFRLTGEISDMSSAGLVDPRFRRWTLAALKPFGLERHARLFGDGAEPLTIAGAITPQAAAETGLAVGTPVSAGYADGPAMAPRSRCRRREPDQRHRRDMGPQSARHPRAGDGRIGSRSHRRAKAGRLRGDRCRPDIRQRLRMVCRVHSRPRRDWWPLPRRAVRSMQ